MRKSQKTEAIITLREAQYTLRQLAEGHKEMTIQYFQGLLEKLSALQQLFIEETRE